MRGIVAALEEQQLVDPKFSEQFAREWIAAWNSHDLDRILAHYEDGFEMSSPFIRTLAGEPSGKLRGKVAVRAYWEKALQAVPDLHFELIEVLAGAGSMTIYYQGHRGHVAEVVHFGAGGKVRAAFAHYAV